MELKLTNVARASLEELLWDDQDDLHVRDLRQRDTDSKEALSVRKLPQQTPLTFEVFREFCESRIDEVVANIAICLIQQRRNRRTNINHYETSVLILCRVAGTRYRGLHGERQNKYEHKYEPTQ